MTSEDRNFITKLKGKNWLFKEKPQLKQETNQAFEVRIKAVTKQIAIQRGLSYGGESR